MWYVLGALLGLSAAIVADWLVNEAFTRGRS